MYLTGGHLMDICRMGTTSRKPKRAQEITEEQTREVLRNLGLHIRKTRKSLGHRLDHFAYEIGISRSTLIRIEKGDDLLSSSLFRVIFGLGLNLDEFFKEFPSIQPVKPPRPKS